MKGENIMAFQNSVKRSQKASFTKLSFNIGRSGSVGKVDSRGTEKSPVMKKTGKSRNGKQ